MQEILPRVGVVPPPALARNEIVRSQGFEELEEQVLEEAKCVLPDHVSAAEHDYY